MNQNPYLNLSEKKILIAGAGVTGTAAARALTKRGAEIVLVDEKVAHNSEFSLLKPEDVAMKEFDTLLISPGAGVSSEKNTFLPSQWLARVTTS